MALKKAGVQLVAEDYADFVADIAKALKAVEDFGEKGSQSAKASENIFIGAYRKIGAGIVDFAAEGAKAIGGFVADSVSAAGDFEAGMNSFQAVSNLDTTGLAQFKDLFLSLGKELPVSTSEVQQAATELVKGGISPATLAAGGLKTSLQFAAAGELDLAQAATIGAKVVGGWTDTAASAGDKATFMAQAMDLMTQAANASTVDVDELAAGLYNVQGTARAAGVGFTDTVTTLAAVSSSFNSASEAGTSMKNFIVRLQPSTRPAIDAMTELGLYTAQTGSAFYDSQGKFVGMEQASALLQNATMGLTDAQKVQALQTIFGNDAMGVASKLTELGAAGFDAMAKSMAGQANVADTAAMKQQGYNTALDNAKGSVEALQIVVGSALLPVLTNLLNNVIAPGVNIVTDFADALGGNAAAFARLPGPIQAAVTGIGAIANAAGDAAAAFETDGLGGAIATFGADISEINPALGSFISSLAPLGDMAETVGNAILDAADSFGTDGLGGALSTLGADLSEIDPALGAFISALAPIGDAIQTVAASLMSNNGAWASYQQIVTSVSNAINQVVMAVFGQIAVFLQAHGAEIGATMTTAWTQIQAIAQTSVQLIQATVVPVLTAVASFIQAHGTEIQAVLSATWTTISTVITTTLAVIQGVITAVLQVVQGNWGGAWQTIQATTNTVLAAIGTIVQAQMTAVQTVIASVWQGIQTQTAATWQAIQTAVFTALNSLASGALTTLTSMAQTIYSTLSSTASSAAQQAAAIGSGIIEGIRSAIMNKVQSLADAAASAVRSAIDAAKRAVGISSPSQVAYDELGVPIVEGISTGIEDTAPDLAATAVAAVDDTTDAMVKANAHIDTVVGEPMLQGVIDGLIAMQPDLLDEIDTISKKSKDAFKKMLDDINTLIEQSFEATISAIDDMSKALDSAMATWDQSSQMADINKLTDDLGDAQQEMADIQQEMADTAKERADISNKLIADESELTALKNEQIAAQQQLTDAQNAYDTATSQVDAAQQQVDAFKKQEDTIKQQQADLDQQYKSGALDKANYDSQSLYLSGQLLDAQETEAEYQDDLNTAKDAQKDAQKQLNDAQDAYDDISKSVADTQKTINDDLEKQTELEQEAIDLANELADAKTAVTQAQSDLNDAVALNNQLYAIQQQELAQLQQAQVDAAKIADPKEAEKYLKIQTDYIEQSASLQSDIAKAQADQDYNQVNLLKQQQAMLDQQYMLQQQQLQYEMDTTTNASEQVANDTQATSTDEMTQQTLEALNNSINDLNNILMAGIPVVVVSGHAAGTASAAAGLAWVGEYGKELVNFSGGEQVYDHKTSMAMVQPVASAGQILYQNSGNSSSSSATYNYSPVYQSAPMAPQQDFALMKAGGLPV